MWSNTFIFSLLFILFAVNMRYDEISRIQNPKIDEFEISSFY